MNKNRKTLMFQYKRPRKFLGPSDIYTVLGLSRFESADELKNRIMKIISCNLLDTCIYIKEIGGM